MVCLWFSDFRCTPTHTHTHSPSVPRPLQYDGPGRNTVNKDPTPGFRNNVTHGNKGSKFRTAPQFSFGASTGRDTGPGGAPKMRKSQSRTCLRAPHPPLPNTHLLPVCLAHLHRAVPAEPSLKPAASTANTKKLGTSFNRPSSRKERRALAYNRDYSWLTGGRPASSAGRRSGDAAATSPVRQYSPKRDGCELKVNLKSSGQWVAQPPAASLSCSRSPSDTTGDVPAVQPPIPSGRETGFLEGCTRHTARWRRTPTSKRCPAPSGTPAAT